MIVNTATIFLVVAIGGGGEARVNEQYSKLNVGTIMVMPAQRGRVADPLTKKDAQLFLESESIAQAFPVLRGNGSINYDSFSTSGSFTAILPQFQESNNLTVQLGRAIEEDDEKKKIDVQSSVRNWQIHLQTETLPKSLAEVFASIIGNLKS